MLRSVLITLSLCLAVAAGAQSVDTQDLDALTKAEAEAKAKAGALAAQSAEVETEILQAKETLRRSAAEQASYERAARDIDEKLTTLTRDEARIVGRISDDRKSQNELLAALQRVSMTPPATISAQAKTARDTARASMIMTSLTSQLESRAAQLSAELEKLTKLRTEIASEQVKLAESETALNEKRDSIRALVKTKAAKAASLSDSVIVQQKKAQALAAKANDLRELMKRFERAADEVIPRLKPAPGRATPRVKPKPGTRPPEPLNLPKGTRFADARGGLQAPVQGTLKSGYGSGRKGLTVSTRKTAQVIMPFTGRVEFAGAFKNYDNVVILNVGSNYFMLLTGLGEIFVDSGEMVSAGEPVGLMPANAAAPELYIELRQNGKPINPSPWLGNAFAARG